MKSTGMSSRRGVVLVLNESGRLSEIRAQLSNLEHKVEVTIGSEQLQCYLESEDQQGVFLLDAELFGGEDREAVLTRLIALLDGKKCAVLSENSSFKNRAASVALGARAFLQIPLDPSVLSERLDVMTLGDDEQAPARIFILQYGEGADSGHLKLCLEEAGMNASLFTSADTMFDALDEHRPELFLFDQSGVSLEILDIVKAIRQDANLLGVPILLSTENTGMNGFLSAVQAGCDNIIEKPAQAAHLLTAVRPRVARFRRLRASMATDGLTGLYNHTYFKERLQGQVSQRMRTMSPISLAMIDIDSFKQINDTHGHPAGDSVLRHLAQLLKGRLRRSDILGRYGGDEFAVLMPDTEIHDAARVLEQVRRRFHEIEHQGSRNTFRASFSCGIAAFPTYSSEATLTSAADQALYEAKGQGKNRIYAKA